MNQSDRGETAETSMPDGLPSFARRASDMRRHVEQFSLRPVLEPSGRLLLARRMDERAPDIHRYPLLPAPARIQDGETEASLLLMRVRRDLSAASAAVQATGFQDMESLADAGVFSGPATPLGWITTNQSMAVGWTVRGWRTSAARIALPAQHGGLTIDFPETDHGGGSGLIFIAWGIQYASSLSSEPEDTNVRITGAVVSLQKEDAALPFKTPVITQSQTPEVERQSWSAGVFISPVAWVQAPSQGSSVPRVVRLGSRAAHLASNGACASDHFFWKPSFQTELRPGPP